MNKHKRPKKPDGSGTWLRTGQTWMADKAPVLFFGAKFGLLVFLLYVLLAMPLADRILYSYLEINAWASNAILKGLGQGTHLTDVTIHSPAFTVAIRRGCDAVEPTWLLCAAILAFPGTLRSKVGGMIAGAVILQLLNLVRIVSLYLIGCHFPALFPSAHLEIWPTLFIMVSIMIFVRWRGWTNAG